MYNELGLPFYEQETVQDTPRNQMDTFLDDLFSKLNGADDARELVQKATFLKPGAKETILFLISSGQFDKSAKASALGQAAKNLFTRGKTDTISIRLDEMKNAIKKAQSSNEMQFIYTSNGAWKSESVSSYRSNLKTKGVTYLNRGLFFDVMKTNNPDGYFGRDITELIAVYLEGKNWKSGLMKGEGTFETIDLSSHIPYFQALARNRWTRETKLINPIFEGISRNFQNNPEVRKATEVVGEKAGLPLKNGVFDSEEFKKQFFAKEENRGKSDEDMLLEMKKEVDAFLSKSKSIQDNINKQRGDFEKKLGNKTTLSKFSELQGIDFTVLEKGKKISVKDISITNLRGDYARQILAQIGEKYKDKLPSDLVNLVVLLGLQIKQEEVIISIASTKEAKRAIDKKEKPDQRKLEIAGNTAKSRLHVENSRKATGNISDQEAWEKLRTLEEKEKKGSLSEKENEELANLKQRKVSTGDLASQYVYAKETFGEEEAKRIFAESNQVVSNNPSEKYDFKALEKVATLTDPESTPGQKSFARLEVGQSLPMWKALEGELQVSVMYAPELAQVTISKNIDGTYNIPMFEAKNISEKQVQEYKESTKLYAELGLSQFIPHIPLINTELRKKGIDATVDGQVSTNEQQQILKALYSKLFGKEIISSSLGEVERAYGSALGNPINMKSAMQHTLTLGKLIPGPNQPISADTLKKWFQETRKDETIDPLKNLTL